MSLYKSPSICSSSGEPNVMNDHRWMDNNESLVKWLNLLNTSPPLTLWLNFIDNYDLQIFLNSYLDNALKSSHTILQNGTHSTNIDIEKQLYKNVFEIVVKLLRITIHYVSNVAYNKKSENFASYITHIIDVIFLVNISSLYFHSTTLRQLIQEYIRIFKKSMELPISDYIQAFHRLIWIKIEQNTKKDQLLFINEVIHTVICIMSIIPEYFDGLMTEDILMRIADIVTNKDCLGILSDNEYNSICNRLVHLIFLHITLLSKKNNPSEKIIKIFNYLSYMPSLLLPLKNIYKLENFFKENFCGKLSNEEYNNILKTFTIISVDYEFYSCDNPDNISIGNKSSSLENDSTSNCNQIQKQQSNILITEKDEQIVLLCDIFPTISTSTLSKCLHYCDVDILKTIDFVIAHHNDESQLMNLLTNINIPETTITPTADGDNSTHNVSTKSFSPPVLKYNIVESKKNHVSKIINNENNTINDITIKLVEKQNQEYENDINKINNLMERYMISPSMAASLLHLDIDQYQDEYDDHFDDDYNHFEYIKSVVCNKQHDLSSSSFDDDALSKLASSLASTSISKDKNYYSSISDNICSIENSVSAHTSEVAKTPSSSKQKHISYKKKYRNKFTKHKPSRTDNQKDYR